MSAKMHRKPILFFILASLLLGSCQSLFSPADVRTPVFPTPFQETLEADQIQPTTVAQTPAPTSTEKVSTSSTEILPSPTETQLTTTQIFPEATLPYQPKYTNLAQAIDQIITQSGGRWHIVLREVEGQTFYSLLAEQRINIASVVKVPLALLFFAALEEKGVSEYQLVEHIQSTGTGGRTFEQLLYAMLVESEEDATEVIADYIDEYVNVPAQLRAWQLEDIDLEARRYTAVGIASLFERLYQGEFVSPTARELILSYLSEYTPNDESRIGVLRDLIPMGYQIYNKRGSLLTPYVVADSAILENPNGTDYVVTIFAYNSDPKTTYENLDLAVGEIALAFWNFISTAE
jgi:beta-lactamase class A